MNAKQLKVGRKRKSVKRKSTPDNKTHFQQVFQMFPLQTGHKSDTEACVGKINVGCQHNPLAHQRLCARYTYALECPYTHTACRVQQVPAVKNITLSVSFSRRELRLALSTLYICIQYRNAALLDPAVIINLTGKTRGRDVQEKDK